MTIYIAAYMQIRGLAFTLETLCGQAYGAGEYRLVGVYLQRMLAFLSLLSVPMAILCWNAGALLGLIVEQSLADLSGLYVRIMILGIPAFLCCECAKSYLQAQGDYRAASYIAVIVAPVNLFLQWLLTWRLGWGFVGSPIAVLLTFNLQAILLFFYVRLFVGYKCWGGLTRDAWHGWGMSIHQACHLSQINQSSRIDASTSCARMALNIERVPRL